MFSLPLNRLIHDNLSVIMTFAFSRQPLADMMDREFRGEWKYLSKALFEVSEMRAQRACVEFAVLLRALDDRDQMPDDMRTGAVPGGYGDLTMPDGSKCDLNLREVTNKIIHAESFTWDFSRPGHPVLICEGQDNQKWKRAEIHWVQVAAACGNIMS
jgi:hypothetical protein